MVISLLLLCFYILDILDRSWILSWRGWKHLLQEQDLAKNSFFKNLQLFVDFKSVFSVFLHASFVIILPEGQMR